MYNSFESGNNDLIKKEIVEEIRKNVQTINRNIRLNEGIRTERLILSDIEIPLNLERRNQDEDDKNQREIRMNRKIPKRLINLDVKLPLVQTGTSNSFTQLICNDIIEISDSSEMESEEDEITEVIPNKPNTDTDVKLELDETEEQKETKIIEVIPKRLSSTNVKLPLVETGKQKEISQELRNEMIKIPDTSNMKQEEKDIIDCAKYTNPIECKKETPENFNISITPNSKIEKFKCSYCNHKCFHRQNMFDHIKDHIEAFNTKTDDEECNFCDYQTNVKHKLIRHIRHKHLKKYKCPNCPYTTGINSHIEKHMETIHESINKFECNRCDYETNHEQSLKYHIDYDVHFVLKKILCSFCDYITTDNDNLKKHNEEFHGMNEIPSEKFESDNDNSNEIMTPNSTATNSSSSSSTSLYEESQKNVTEKSKLKSKKCPHCNYSSVHNNVNRHILSTHLNLKRFQCPYCDYFSFKRYVDKHIEKKHSKEQKETKHLLKIRKKCHNKRTIDHFNTLIESIHKENDREDNKPIEETQNKSSSKLTKQKCQYCEKIFRTEATLKSHIDAAHLKIKQFKCPLCDYKGLYKMNIVRHIKSEHPPIDDNKNNKKYRCKMCSYTSRTKQLLNNHIGIIHLGIKKYECDFCEYKAIQKNNLFVHLKRIHLKENGYKCKYCDYLSSKKYDLIVHFKNLHKEEQ